MFPLLHCNLKDNKRNLEISHTSYAYCILDCRTMELSDYRAVGLAIGSPFEWNSSTCTT